MKVTRPLTLLTFSLGSSNFFSTLDAAQAISISCNSNWKEIFPSTEFARTFGLFHFCRMPFGFKNGGADYSRFVQKVVLHVPWWCFVEYRWWNSHFKLLDLVFQAHRVAGIKLNADETFLSRTEVKYLRHLISKKVISLITAYVSKIVEWPLTSNREGSLIILGFLLLLLF